ncbi:P-loop containing nucleoside triphosphate hydrolase protein [Microthyrium microscopicum]|uniref:P-loop containing nucleoside triphosphate hydrolase protein n=1 Tax=Microthyrium microscopicum TaxID=703497 RepID=A0A6A6U1T0_9PEZI|nr:P-loop containing nucleoside triphosphate hydrolase protein [Microthyrium microscopicum]
MASIFTFDPSPPSVSSPWATPRTSTPRLGGPSSSPSLGISGLDISTHDDENIIVTSLVAEPQEGPTEYKLHLLLRQRRSFVYSSTNNGQSHGSYRSPSLRPQSSSSSSLGSPQAQAYAVTSRQLRLDQLTTQLLWRLQQTSSYHHSSYKPTQGVLEQLAKGSDKSPQTIFPGLEDSKGALYEIGVADDGTFVGLADDELDESIETLQTMAASLGCIASVLRKVAVGECQWLEPTSGNQAPKLRKSKLWVAEAYVRPNFNAKARVRSHSESSIEPQPISVTDQLRVTLTGTTMSGKSSLLGTLTTATLDNGRGKSRLSLLKHQHEIKSGMTSSVTHELLGYHETSGGDTQAVNFASANVSSWVDIHTLCAGASGRLVFFSDSAGHPRFRRTTVRGLIGWAPHWTVLCIPADNSEDTAGRLGSTPPSHETLGLPLTGSGQDVDLSQEHLELCLKLDLPLVIVITKIDLASRVGLRSYLNKILTALKRAGRQPLILPDYRVASEGDMCLVNARDMADMKSQIQGLQENHRWIVPIVLTSAVKGTGIKTLHALLNALPIPQPKYSSINNSALFDIEDTFTGKPQVGSDTDTIILSGAVRQGTIKIGDELLVGPYLVNAPSTTSSARRQQNDSSEARLSAFRRSSGASPDLANMHAVTPASEEWCLVRVYSVRHLRLPARALISDQVGTIAVVPCTPVGSRAWRGIRKGMILATGPHLQARRTFAAEFSRRDVDPLSIGSGVVVYFNSVRASAKIIAGAMVQEPEAEAPNDDDGALLSDEEELAFGFEDDLGNQAARMLRERDEKLLVTFQFIASREFVQVGSQVLVTPGGGAGLAGLSGFVGRVVEV